MDVFLIILTIIVGLLLIVCNVYIFTLYCHSEENGFGSNILCKIIIISGLTLAEVQILMMPLDIAMSRGITPDFGMKDVWYGIYITILVYVTFIIPFAQFFYESDEEKPMLNRFCTAVLMVIGTIFLFGVFICIFYLFCSKAEIPIVISSKDDLISQLVDSNVKTDFLINSRSVQINQQQYLEFQVSLYIAIMAFLSFLGYSFLVCFGGMGFSALPIDLIKEFTQRPNFLTTGNATVKKSNLSEKVKQLIKLGQMIENDQNELQYQKGFWKKRRNKNKLQSEFQIFQEAVLQLSDQHELFKLELNIQEVNPLVYYGKLVLGIIGIFLSLVWWLHILLASVIRVNGYPIYPLMDRMFIRLENIGLDFIGVTLYTILTLYLLWCTSKGNFKVGITIPFLFTIHPMRPNETWMNSFLFNLNLLLITSVSIVHFCQSQFKQYARFTQLESIYGNQVTYLEFYKYLYQYNVFEIAILAISGLGLIYFSLKREKQNQLFDQIHDKKKQIKQYKGKKEVQLQELLIKKEKKESKKQKSEKKKEEKEKKKKDKEKEKKKAKDSDEEYVEK